MYKPHFIDLVLCMHKDEPELYYAPKFSYLQKNDRIYVEGQKKEVRVVYDTISIDTNSRAFDFMLALYGIKAIKRVIAIEEVSVKVFEYEEE